MGLGETFSGLWLGGGRVTDRIVPEGGSCDRQNTFALNAPTPYPPPPMLSPSPSTPPRTIITASGLSLFAPLLQRLDSFASLEI